MSSLVASLTSLRVSKYVIPAYGGFPNSSLHPNWPLFIYHSAFAKSVTVQLIETHLQQIGVVRPAWRYTMYREHHFHSTTHEVLVVYAGAATVCFGGGSNPKKVVHRIEKGDVVVIPAGVAHGMLDADAGFMMVGSYPVDSAQWDLCTGEGDEVVYARIKALTWFARDPVYGDIGPVAEIS
jgi:uncharacterized protein YjlB